MDSVNFIEWLISRLIYKHGYANNDSIIYNLQNIKQQLKPKEIQIDIKDEDLDLILAKYYPDFNLDITSEMKIGFSNEDRKSIRLTSKAIAHDIINRILPLKDSLIK